MTADRPASAPDRRVELADAVCRVMAARGIQGTSMREVAREAGWTTGALVHYFGDKAGMLEFASQTWMERMRQGATAAIGDRVGLAALRAFLASDLPADDPSTDEGLRIWHSMMESATRDDRLAQIWHGLYDDYRGDCERLLRQAMDQGEIPASCDVPTTATILMAAVDGLNLRRVIDPEGVTGDDQLRVLDRLLASLTAR